VLLVAPRRCLSFASLAYLTKEMTAKRAFQQVFFERSQASTMIGQANLKTRKDLQPPFSLLAIDSILTIVPIVFELVSYGGAYSEDSCLIKVLTRHKQLLRLSISRIRWSSQFSTISPQDVFSWEYSYYCSSIMFHNFVSAVYSFQLPAAGFSVSSY
jgi:hypothetical protein